MDPGEEYEILVTRACSYTREPVEISESSTPDQRKTKTSNRKSEFLKCSEHDDGGSSRWSDEVNGACSKCFKYSTIFESFNNGILPRKKEVLSYLLTLRHSNNGKQNASNFHNCALDLSLHWIYCNVYPISIAASKKRIQTMFDDYSKLKRYPKQRRGPTFKKNVDEFLKSQNELFDIIGKYTFQSTHKI